MKIKCDISMTQLDRLKAEEVNVLIEDTEIGIFIFISISETSSTDLVLLTVISRHI